MKTRSLNYLTLFIIVGITVASCGGPDKPAATQTPTKAKDTLAFDYKGFKQRDPSCGDKPDSSCAIFSNQYPWFRNEPELNTFVLELLGNKVHSITVPDTVLKRSADDFMRQYAGDPDSKTNHLYYQSADTILVARQDSAVVGFADKSFIYTGGAHGLYNTVYTNWNIQTKRRIELKDLLVGNYKAPLNTAAEVLFRRQENISALASLKDKYFFKDDKFSLNENFLITPQGLRFLYNPYEIKPYSEGQTELLVPYALIKTLIRPNTVISQYAK